MNDGQWWRLNRAPRTSRFFWITRRQPQPERPLRLSNYVPVPAEVGSFIAHPAEPTEVGWLLQSGHSPQMEAFNVNVEPVPDHAALRHDGEPTSPRTTGVTPSRQQEPQTQAASLADRLRAVLLVPLEVLLPGESSVLEWPSALKEYQLDGVRALLERERMLLADDMGLGKTVQAIAAIRILTVTG